MNKKKTTEFWKEHFALIFAFVLIGVIFYFVGFHDGNSTSKANLPEIQKETIYNFCLDSFEAVNYTIDSGIQNYCYEFAGDYVK